MKNKNGKNLLAILTACSMIGGLTACSEDITVSSGTGTAVNLSAVELADAIYTKIPLTEDLSYQDGETMGLLMNLGDYTEAAGYTASGQIPEMVAVFCGADAAQAETLKTAMNEYVGEMTREYEKYAPEQVEKLEKAIVQTAGNYAVLCVSSDAKTAKQVVGDLLSKGSCNMANLRSASSTPADKPAETTPVDSGSDTEDSVTDGTAVTAPVNPSGNDPIPSGDVPIPSQGDYVDMGAVFRDGDTAFEAYYYNDKYATQYTGAINKFAAKVPDTVKIYDLLIPTSAGITLPDDLVGKCNVQDQHNSIVKSNAKLDSRVNGLDIYDTMRSHRGEYIYFRTDHHWTALGCYYAFADLCKAMGKTAPSLSEYPTSDFTGFLGSFYRDTKEDPKLGANPDTLTVYYPTTMGNITMQYTDTNGKVHDWPLISDVTDYQARLKYSAFAGGDNPLVTTVNTAVEDGSVCILVKESFGNAMIPFLADIYQYVYAVDYRYDKRDFAAFVSKYPNADVIFANNLSALQSSYLCGKMAAYLG